MKRLFTHDPLGKVTRFFHVEEPGTFTIETQQDVTDLVELNKAEHAMTDERERWTGNMTRVARIPLHILYDPRLGLLHDEKALKRWLNDPANQKFRTRPGHV